MRQTRLLIVLCALLISMQTWAGVFKIDFAYDPNANPNKAYTSATLLSDGITYGREYVESATKCSYIQTGEKGLLFNSGKLTLQLAPGSRKTVTRVTAELYPQFVSMASFKLLNKSFAESFVGTDEPTPFSVELSGDDILSTIPMEGSMVYLRSLTIEYNGGDSDITPDAPTISIDNTAQTVTITQNNPQGTSIMYCVTDNPKAEKGECGNVYTAPFRFSLNAGTHYVHAYSSNGSKDSEIVTASYTVDEDTPPDFVIASP